MFNLLIIAFVSYYFYKNSIKTGKFKMFMRRALPELIGCLQSIVDRIDGVKSRRSTSRWHSTGMSLEEARQILGVKPGDSKQEILQAFKKLMLVNHPDKGGTEYLAAKIIQAKERLLNN